MANRFVEAQWPIGLWRCSGQSVCGGAVANRFVEAQWPIGLWRRSGQSVCGGTVANRFVEAHWPIGYGVGLRIKRSLVRIWPWPLRWVLGQGSLLPLSQGEAFTLASISYLAILVKYILAKKNFIPISYFTSRVLFSSRFFTSCVKQWNYKGGLIHSDRFGYHQHTNSGFQQCRPAIAWLNTEFQVSALLWKQESLLHTRRHPFPSNTQKRTHVSYKVSNFNGSAFSYRLT